MLRVGRDAGSWPVRAFAGGHDVLLQQPQYVVGLLLFQDLRAQQRIKATILDGRCATSIVCLMLKGTWRCVVANPFNIGDVPFQNQ